MWSEISPQITEAGFYTRTQVAAFPALHVGKRNFKAQMLPVPCSGLSANSFFSLTRCRLFQNGAPVCFYGYSGAFSVKREVYLGGRSTMVFSQTSAAKPMVSDKVGCG